MTEPHRPEPPTPLHARLAAFGIVRAVLRQRQPLDAAIDQSKPFAALEPRDRAFARLIAATLLRRLGQIDDLVAGCLERPLPTEAAAAHDVLRLGAAQLAFIGTPAHAAVATAVELADQLRLGPFKGLVNAVLRRLAREAPERVRAQDAARLNTPAWLWDAWIEAYGEPTARAIALADLSEPPLDFTLRDPGDATAQAERLGAQVLPTGSLRRPLGGAIADLPGYADGAWWIQDAAAALPARLLGAVAGQRVIDIAAAPGGKTAQLAAAGASVTAIDVSQKRVELLRRNLDRIGLGAESIVADANTWRPEAPADAVLLDAPCTATGTIRRNPDVAHLKRPEDVARLAAVQDRLLRAAIEMVRPGGMVVYACCSLQPEEGPARIAALLQDGAPVRRDPVRPEEVGGMAELVTPEGDLRTLPCHFADRGGLDGFYAARLIRA